jgi:hypothetical protein
MVSIRFRIRNRNLNWNPELEPKLAKVGTGAAINHYGSTTLERRGATRLLETGN